MMKEDALRSVLIDLWHYGFVHLEDLDAAMQLVTLIGDQAQLSSDGGMWRVSIDLYPSSSADRAPGPKSD